MDRNELGTPSKCEHKSPSIFYAAGVLIGILGLILGGHLFLRAPVEAMFLVSWLIVYPACMKLDYTYQEINESAMASCRNGLGAIMILMAVGPVISTWIASGTVPALIYYGLEFINPRNFLLATFWLNSCVALLSGTSWGTMGTIGVAMFTVGSSLGVPGEMTVGAIVSAACVGSFISPMGGPPNIISSACGIDLMIHCRKLSRIVFPAMIGASLFYYYLGAHILGNEFESNAAAHIRKILFQEFRMGIPSLVPITFLLTLLLLRRPAMLSMLASSISALVIAVLCQGTDIYDAMNIFWSGYTIETGDLLLDAALSRGGVRSMLDASCIVLFASGIIGALGKTNILNVIVIPMLKRVKSATQLVAVSQIIAVAGSLVGTYTFAMLIAGSLMLPAYKKFKLHPVNLSMTVCATSIPTTMLVPWNASCIYIVTLFGIELHSFAPYALLAYLVPAMTFCCAALKIGAVYAENGVEY